MGDPVAQGVVQARLADRASRADPPRGPGRLTAAGKEQVKVSAAARSPVPPAAWGRGWRNRGTVTRLTGRHRGGAVTRARHWAANPARSATSRPLAANSSANRRGNRRVVFRAPRQTTVCGSAPAIASRRTVSRETPSRPGKLRGGQEVRGLFRAGQLGLPWERDKRRGHGPGHCLQQLGRDGGTGRWVRVLVGIYRVRLHGGFLLQGPCPLGDLGGWSRGPRHARVCPGIVRWVYARAIVGQFAQAHRAGGRPEVAAGVSRYPGIAADLRAHFGGEREPPCRGCRTLRADTGSTGTPSPGRSRLGGGRSDLGRAPAGEPSSGTACPRCGGRAATG